ncbi:SWIM zinc finger family protein [Mycolicibacterium frederiksbergense]|uniref:SWIM zinc finger family protein n=1 Tax=Mycolicibacterium frederiksbergense TaxID=117567 RepID=UPI00399B29B9
MPLSEEALLTVAGDTVFARGEDYVQYVRGLRTTATKASASIQAKRVYTVELDWSGPGLQGWCTCAHHDEGYFCKHLVAVGLAAIDSGRVPVNNTADDAIEAAVRSMDIDELRDFVISLAQRDSGVRDLLEVRSAASGGEVELQNYVRNALSFRGFIDYRQSYAVAAAAGEVLDELEARLDSGASEIVQPALLLAMTELRDLVEQVDDSSGFIGDECQRAADLYARACRQGVSDPVQLAEWLVTFRATSPGWPHVVLADFVDAFDEPALSTYRDAVAALDQRLASIDRWQRHDVDAMRLELADHDGDVDWAIEVLNHPEHPQYGAIINRLRAVGRADDAVAWMDRAVVEGRVSSRGGGNDFWLSPDDVAQTYLGLGRTEDAVSVLRADFQSQPSVGTYRALLDFAADIDRADAERAWALDHARQLAADRHARGAVLVQLCLSENDVEAAWQAADRYGPGWAWKELAQRGADARPVAAADLYRPKLADDLRYPNSKIYPDIAATLATMAKLYEKGGRSADFAVFMAEIRREYGRRPSLMKALDAKKL